MAGEQTTWDGWDDTNYKENRMSNTGLLQAGGTSKILDTLQFLTVPINFQGTLSQIHLTLPDLSAGTVTVSILDTNNNVVWTRDAIADNGFRVVDVNVQVRGTDKLKISTSLAVSGSKTITIMLLFSRDGTRASLMQGTDINGNTRNVLVDADGKFFGTGGGGTLSTITQEANGAANGGLTIRASAGASTKNRIFEIILTCDADTSIALSDGFGTYYCAAGVPISLKYGVAGKLQNTAATGVTATTGVVANVGALVNYSTEAV